MSSRSTARSAVYSVWNLPLLARRRSTCVQVVLLALTAGLGFLATAAAFAPGYMSTDTLFQLSQALGKTELNDWHPPVMSLLWRGLIAATGSIASMAVLQEFIFWLSLWILSTVVLRCTASLRWAMSTYALALSPAILTFVGVVWKDVQMAFALLAVAAVCLLLPGCRNRPLIKWTLFTLGVVLLAYAALVRKNALFAMLPLLVLLFWATFERPTRSQLVVGSLAFAVALAVPTVAISAVAKPVQTHQVTQVMLDDLLHVMSPQELSRVEAPRPLQEKLSSAARACREKKVLMNTYWDCYGKGLRGSFSAVAYPDEIVAVWSKEMPRHVSGYLQYRARLFTDMLFQNRYFFRAGVQANKLGVAVERPMVRDALKSYVMGSQRDLPWLFSGWLWLALNVYLAVRRGAAPFRWPIRLLGASGALYIIGYFPIVPLTDFRYVYWSVISGSVGLFLVVLSRFATHPAAQRAGGRLHADGTLEGPAVGRP